MNALGTHARASFGAIKEQENRSRHVKREPGIFFNHRDTAESAVKTLMETPSNQSIIDSATDKYLKYRDKSL